MNPAPELEALRQRTAPLAMQPGEFREIGHRFVDEIADRLAKLPDGPVTRDESPAELRQALGAEQTLPRAGTDAGRLVSEATGLLFDHSLFNGHPRFFGYITSSPAPIGMFGDFLAAAVNQNVGASRLAPLATEIEGQTLRWIAELVGFPTSCGGLLVSGGNMANFVCFVAARAAKAPWDVRKEGLSREGQRLLVYASMETHTWIQKAADLFGLGTDAIRWIATDDEQRMDSTALRRQVEEDLRLGHQPFLVVGTAGSVSTGAVDSLPDIAAICREHELWFHVDGAYGALAAYAPGAPASLRALGEADSVAVDPHKWLYAPLEAGCVLVRDAQKLRNAFSYHPAYYHFDDQVVNYFDYGPQNSRGFRALKVWLALRQVGRAGYLKMIGDDILLARHLHQLVAHHPEFEAATQSLSITTFRYVPRDLRAQLGSAKVEEYLNQLNQNLLTAVEKSGEAFMSNALVRGRYLLRACIVNFHTSLGDIEALPPLLSRLGREVDTAQRKRLRPERGAQSPRESERGWGPASILRKEAVVKGTLEKGFGYQGDKMHLPVRDVAAALPFYETVLGFRLLSRSDTPHNSAVLARDQVEIGLAENGGDPTQDGCAFHVKDLESLFAEFQANGLHKERSEFDIEQRGDGAWKVFYVVAPDGLCYWFGERQDVGRTEGE